ncbi:MAG: hypothetical protein MUC80_07305 [Candidatus Thermoplasmatota archaeon]|jgi:hypothetical protein|nr:hypothetical protein [Candidatus Thermoplasmatota archaeon]
MDSYTVLPNPIIDKKGIISEKFTNLKIKNFWDACTYVHDIPYGYNSTTDDLLILFKEGYGSCTTKHTVIATLAEELGIPVYKMVGIYEMNEEIVTGTNRILEKYHLPYLPMIHCFLVYYSSRVDLTEGNDNGKNHSIEELLFTEKVAPNISEKDEYLLYKNALKNNILPRKEMEGITMINVLHARTEGIALLRSKIPNQFQ